jgi:hypothetical protein
MYTWKDGNRLFVDLNGATIEVQSLTLDQQVVTLRFHARVVPLNAGDRHADAVRTAVGPVEVVRSDSIAANEARVAAPSLHARDPLLA